MKRTVLITGASEGIGRALAYRYANAGDRVMLLARNGERLASLSRDLETAGAAVAFLVCDVTKRDQVREAVRETLGRYGRIDLAILNAGVGGPERMENFSSENMQEVFNVNVMGVAHVLEALLPVMKQQRGGVIAGVSSLADVRGFNGSACYCASKAALSTLLESARIELRPLGIRVVTVRPGFVRTQMTARNRFRMPLLMSAEHAADAIHRGLEKRRSVVSFPWLLAAATSLVRMLPPGMFDALMKMRMKGMSGQVLRH